MSTILVVDDMAMCREPIAEALRAHGHCVSCAAGGTEALESLRDRKPDLVLLDVTMPEPDGLTVLRTMRQNPELKETPVILLTDRADKDTVTQAARWGVQAYLIKANFSLNVLLERVDACVRKANPVAAGAQNKAIKKQAGSSTNELATGTTATIAVAPAAGRSFTPPLDRARDEDGGTDEPIGSLHDLVPVITKTRLTKLVNDGLKLKPLAATVHNVIAVTGSSGCSAADVAKAVASDQALCIRLLKLANSSAYSRGRPVDSIQAAVQRIGIHEVRKIVMTLGVFEQYVGGQSDRMDIRLFWEHSIACGLIAAAIGKECKSKAVDDCFLWGTVHDVGRLILLDHLPKEYNQVWNAADKLALPIEVVEPKLMLLDHCEVLNHALNHWQFPHAFITPVVSHHESVDRLKRLGPEHAQAATIVAVANRIAHALLLGCSGNEVIYPFVDLVEALGVSASAIEKIVATVPDETRDLKLTMLAHAASDTWPDFGTMVRARLDSAVRPLCVSSDPSMDAFSLFLDQVGEHGGTEPPNLGVLSLSDASEAAALFAEFERSETKAGLSGLPLIVICAKGAAKLGEAPWRARSNALLKTPVPISLFIKSVRGMLAQVVES
jgi:HD-like signal output (HDOD) protein/DNA-binding NarL/FixJ family response regulator